MKIFKKEEKYLHPREKVKKNRAPMA